MKKILIALDTGLAAEKVANAGYKIASDTGAEVLLVHVITDPGGYNHKRLPFMEYYNWQNTGITTQSKSIKKQAEKFLMAAVVHLGDSAVSARILEGNAGEEILHCAEEWGADLIVTGMQRHHEPDSQMEDYVAGYILARSRIPMYIIPAYDKYEK